MVYFLYMYIYVVRTVYVQLELGGSDPGSILSVFARYFPWSPATTSFDAGTTCSLLFNPSRWTNSVKRSRFPRPVLLHNHGLLTPGRELLQGRASTEFRAWRGCRDARTMRQLSTQHTRFVTSSLPFSGLMLPHSGSSGARHNTHTSRTRSRCESSTMHRNINIPQRTECVFIRVSLTASPRLFFWCSLQARLSLDWLNMKGKQNYVLHWVHKHGRARCLSGAHRADDY